MKKTILYLTLMIASTQSYGVTCGTGMIDNGKGNVILSLQSPNNLKPRWDNICDTLQYQNAISEYLEDMINDN
ncbi:hypothetical protein QJU23_01640 [Pasteurella atlantica]|uniref:Uncharacterized protein n=2 Tax=Pasteurellaceae TaxID=712 RepID=A0ACC6HJS2_9PAST|nr:hypothetical protein [Pasteurella atlantica]MDP8051126.1 hypothetical protein [Pasteurella atlantica]MDP8104422.1 hypothetical protein [Pasteurella atlantica]MDP8147782.1 hypothetical protein [Pasteurella atlantica]